MPFDDGRGLRDGFNQHKRTDRPAVAVPAFSLISIISVMTLIGSRCGINASMSIIGFYPFFSSITEKRAAKSTKKTYGLFGLTARQIPPVCKPVKKTRIDFFLHFR
jgi:hypothetical protein